MRASLSLLFASALLQACSAEGGLDAPSAAGASADTAVAGADDAASVETAAEAAGCLSAVSDFDVSATSSEPVSFSVELANVCDVELALDGVGLDDHHGGFALGEVAGALPAGGAVAVPLTFTPQGGVLQTATLQVRAGGERALVELAGQLSDGPRSGEAPVAVVAETNQYIDVGADADLDGSGSYDPEGDALTYSWSFVYVPSGSALTTSDIVDATSANASFTADVEGKYRMRFVVGDGTSTGKVFSNVYAVDASNSAPVADAGANIDAETGLAVALDGAASSDADGDALTWTWSFASVPEGSALTHSDISDGGDGFASFTPDVDGEYNVRMVVSDGSETDKDFVKVTATTSDADGDGYSADVDCDDSAETGADVHPGADEICDGIDNDCDDRIDDDDNDVTDGATWHVDYDGDGYGAATRFDRVRCEAPSGYTADSSDCDDFDAASNPAGTEVCDGADNDCDGLTDDEDTVSDAITWYADADSDGFGDVAVTAEACDEPSGYTADSSDCDDDAGEINPVAAEVCDGVDNDCDGAADDGAALDMSTWYLDADADGYGDADGGSTEACAQPSGYSAVDSDCDDSAGTGAAVYPGADEACDGIDNDCDGRTDDDSASDRSTWYIDFDSDGYGASGVYDTAACDQPSGYVADATDCDDADSASHPGGTEVCDGADNDCDGTADNDDATDASAWYADGDGDGYGDPASGAVACDAPSGHVADSADCDDSLSAVNPAETEICDGIDNDCDGLADDEDDVVAGRSIWYADGDSDGFGVSGDSVIACDAPSGYADPASGEDCDDDDGSTWPGATELCDGVPNDCDDAAWSSDAGLASLQGSDGLWSDYASTFGAGSAGAPAAISLADGETLNVCEGTWYVNISGSGDNTLYSPDGPDLTALDGDGTGRVFDNTTVGAVVAIEGVTLTNGYNSSQGGALRVNNVAEFTLTDAAITDSESTKGGGAHVYGVDAMTWTGVTVSGNLATSGYGGGVNLWDVTEVYMIDVVIDSNQNSSAYGGGGLAMYGAITSDLYGLTVTDNYSASGYGGGVSIISGTHTFEGFIVADNEANGAGGGIDSTGDVTLIDGTLSGNTGNYGGAMRIKGATLDATEVIFDANTANNTGSAIHIASSGDTYLTDCDVTDNIAPSSKPALNVSSGYLEVSNGDFSGNVDYDVKSGSDYTYGSAASFACDGASCY